MIDDAALELDALSVKNYDHDDDNYGDDNDDDSYDDDLDHKDVQCVRSLTSATGG